MYSTSICWVLPLFFDQGTDKLQIWNEICKRTSQVCILRPLTKASNKWTESKRIKEIIQKEEENLQKHIC